MGLVFYFFVLTLLEPWIKTPNPGEQELFFVCKKKLEVTGRESDRHRAHKGGVKASSSFRQVTVGAKRAM